MVKISREQENLIRKIYSMSDDEINQKKIQTLKKMQLFLEEKKIAKDFREIKNLPRIDIKGTDSNGKERLIAKELREKLKIDVDEAKEIFNDRYPIFEEGVIRFQIENKGTYYLHFKVFNLQENTFGLKITQYKFYNGTFYMTFYVEMKEISKKTFPSFIGDQMGLDVRTILFNTEYLENETRQYFDNFEKNIIITSIREDQQDIYSEYDAIIYNTLSYFAAINYLKRKYANQFSTLWDNEYFSIKNWNLDAALYDVDKSFKEASQEYCDNIISKYSVPRVLRKNTIGMIINRIVEKEKITSVKIAVGFAFSSGLQELRPLFEDTDNNGGNIELIIGALQYYENDAKNCKMDLKTAKQLNDFQTRYGIKLYTYSNAFYHGKVYLITTQSNVYVILGSSNVSKTAFFSNYEMDVMFKFKHEDIELQEFYQNYMNLRNSCKELGRLNEERFENIDWQTDLMSYNSSTGRSVSEKTIREKVNELTDDETKYRLTLWLKYHPDAYYQEFDIGALKNYTLFFYEDKGIVVFESFVPGNAYYIFQSIRGVDDLIQNIKRMTKSEMKISEFFVERGNHTENRKRIENRIISLFS